MGFVTRFLAGLIVSAAALNPSAAAEPKKTNVVFILVDDMGWGDLGCYGNSAIKTPNLDRLAKQGMLLEDFYVNAPVCSPSRASFMTGRYPISVGLPHIVMKGKKAEQYGSAAYLDPKFPTVTRLFQDAGYVTGHYGKWHLGFTDGPEVGEYGIDESETAHANGPQFALYESPKNDDERREFRARSTELIIDASINFIDRHRNEPFYLNVWTIVPHSPFAPTKEQLAAYPRLDQPRYIPHVSARQIYYAMVTDLDRHVGRLLDRLEELGLEEDTIVVFSSDNGPEHDLINNAGYSAVGSTGPFRGVKRSLYDGGIRMPFIARWPGKIPENSNNHTNVMAAIDYLPTISAMCGVKLPESIELDGENRSAILLGEHEPRSEPVMWEWRSQVFGQPFHQSPRFALRDGDWKFLMNDDRERVELYKISEDYGELDNVADEHPDKVEEYADRLEAFAKAMPPGPVQPEAGQRDLPLPERNSSAP